MGKGVAGKFKYSMSFKNLNKSDAEYSEIIYNVLLEADSYSTAERIVITQDITDSYREQYGEELKPHFLEALANFILNDVLTDKRVNKVTYEDFPILSDRQLYRRERRERIMEADTMDYFEHQEEWQLGAKKAHEKADY